MVSAALVVQRELEGEATVAAKPSDGGPGSSPAEPDAGKLEPTTRPDPGKAESELMSKVGQKKKMVQHPVYFVSSLLQGARSRYSGMHKLLFGLLMALRKLHHYFQAHEITIVTRLPLQGILHNPDATGRIVEWALELSSFGL